ncbi:MAG TPA: N-acetylmuramoyl-L-alanine amidase [Acetivibrio sp.]|nr:N-acetylmuramoyl-L-alanine amidase [Acetivibrio sp.]
MGLKSFMGKILRLPPRTWIMIFILAVAVAIGIGVYSDRTKNEPRDNSHLTDNKNKTGNDGASVSDGTGPKEEKKPKEVIVVIDPGHGGEDLGAYNGNLLEKDINLDISLMLGEILDELGINVVYTRETDVFIDLIPRSDIANELDATLFISVHSNAMEDYPDYKGTETLYCPPPQNPRYTKMDGKKLAKIVQRELVKALGTADNGIIERPNLSVLRRTKMPAIIAEIAYLSNPSDRAKLADASFRKKAAKALADAVVKALNEMGAVKDEKGVFMIMEE